MNHDKIVCKKNLTFMKSRKPRVNCGSPKKLVLINGSL